MTSMNIKWFKWRMKPINVKCIRLGKIYNYNVLEEE